MTPVYFSDQPITDLAQWLQGREFVLWSGLVVRLRPVHILDLVGLGFIPNTMAEAAADMINTFKWTDVDVSRVPEYTEILNMVVTHAITRPIIGDKTDLAAGILGVNDIPFLERLAIYNEVSGSGPMRPFRPEPPVAASGGGDGAGIPDPTERPVGDNQHMDGVPVRSNGAAGDGTPARGRGSRPDRSHPTAK